MSMSNGKSGKKMMKRSFSFNTEYLMPTQGYYNQLKREIDDAFWEGDDDEANRLELIADDVEQTLTKGSSWHPLF